MSILFCAMTFRLTKQTVYHLSAISILFFLKKHSFGLCIFVPLDRWPAYWRVKFWRYHIFQFHFQYKQNESSTEVTLLRVKFEKQLKFQIYIEELYRKATLCGIRKYLTVKKAKPLANAFINNQFSYAPLIWLLKFVEYTFEQFKLFKIIMINHIMTYWISVMMYLSTRGTYDS